MYTIVAVDSSIVVMRIAYFSDQVLEACFLYEQDCKVIKVDFL